MSICSYSSFVISILLFYNIKIFVTQCEHTLNLIDKGIQDDVSSELNVMFKEQIASTLYWSLHYVNEIIEQINKQI